MANCLEGGHKYLTAGEWSAIPEVSVQSLRNPNLSSCPKCSASVLRKGRFKLETFCAILDPFSVYRVVK